MIHILLLLEVAIISQSRALDKIDAHIEPIKRPVKAGDNVLLNCSAVANRGPADEISWSLVDVAAPFREGVHEIRKSPYWLGLLLANVTFSDEGGYRCLAEKDEKTDEQKLQLKVYAKPQIKLREIWIMKPGTVNDTLCEAIGRPKPTITWYYNGKLFTDGADQAHSISVEDKKYEDKMKTVSKLSIASAEKGLNDGNFTCQANNSEGDVRRTLLLLLADVPQINAIQTQLIVPEGANVSVTCEGKKLLKEDSQVTTDWKFEGEHIPLITTSQYEVKNTRAANSMHLELTVFKVSTNDSGCYKCSIVSTGGEAYDEIMLHVVSKDIQPTVEIRGKRTIEAAQGSPVQILCEVTYPLYMKTVRGFWLKETDRRLVEVPHRKINKRQDRNICTDMLSLNIANVSHQDEGLYVCELNTRTSGMYTAEVQLIITNKNRDSVKRQEGRSASSLLPTVLVIGAGVLCVLIGLVFGCRLMRSKRRHPSFHGPTNNMEFKYDVFITFSGKDFEWVKINLIPLLEEYGVQYCIHHRDFELGMGVFDNMANSVYTSKKVLAILSKNYVTSKYCQSELEMALYRDTEQGDSSLIVIVIDDIDKEYLPKSLRSRTFLDYHDKIERKTWEERLMKHLNKNITMF